MPGHSDLQLDYVLMTMVTCIIL